MKQKMKRKKKSRKRVLIVSRILFRIGRFRFGVVLFEK
jgi:hypothetical protein